MQGGARCTSFVALVRILFLTQYYPPESNAPANRVSLLARRWVARGAEVEVVTGFPNHPEGQIYPGYTNGRPLRERHDGVDVLRLPVYVAANRGRLRRGLAYGSFCASAASLGLVGARRPDVLIATSPQILVGLAGAIHSALRRVPMIFEVRDLWPDSIVAVGALSEGHPALWGLRKLEEGLYARAARVVVVTQSFKRILGERSVSADRVDVFPNGLDTALFSPAPPAGREEPDRWPGRFVVSFAGTIGMAHGIGTLLDAARLLRDDPEVLFVVAGSGADLVQLRARAVAERLDNVEFLGRIPRAEIPPLLRRTDLSLVMLRDSPLFRTVLPSKIFEAMGSARPILLGVDGEARELVEGAGAGVFFPPGDAASLAAQVRRLKSDDPLRARMGAAGLHCARTEYDSSVIADRYLAMIQGLVGAGG